ncbi:MAG: ECF transporter S component [Lactobacillales bacterium]|jgi:uncharacterized membrane protein|nr:ECF transporter S component [Lactobacillales bacterium]
MNAKNITLHAVLVALTVSLSLLVIIPVPATNGLVTLCEVGIYTSALLLGARSGLLVGASSGLLIDLISGYPQWIIFSLIIHGAQGYLAGKIGFQRGNQWKIAGLLIAGVVMIIGYTIAGTLLYGFGSGIASIPGNIVQNGFGYFMTIPLVTALKRVPAIRNSLN